MTDIIYSYTREQAIADGWLVPFADYLREEHADGPCTHESRSVMESLTQAESSFPLGELVITASAAAELAVKDVLSALFRHLRGDWGDLDPEDWQANIRALKYEHRLFSVYKTETQVRFYVITEWNREATTVLLPEDY